MIPQPTTKTFSNHPTIAIDAVELDCETLEHGRFYTTPQGNRYKSVTTVLGQYTDTKAGIEKWKKRIGETEAKRILERAGVRGTTIHSMCENYLNNDDPFAIDHTKSDSIMFRRMQRTLNSIDNVVAQEVALYSDILRVAGRVDCIAEYKGELSIIDFKTSLKDKDKEYIDNYFMQCCCYSIAFKEMFGISINKAVIIMGSNMSQKALVFEDSINAYLPKLVEVIKRYHAA